MYLLGVPMAVNLDVTFSPEKLKMNAKNDAFLVLKFTNTDNEKIFWCETDVLVKHPLSLAFDRELELGRTRVGILKPNKSAEKKVRIYTRPNNYPGAYSLAITAYVYDEEGVISERLERKAEVECVEIRE
jgi:hypothetical protein